MVIYVENDIAMINLDEKFSTYLGSKTKTFRIDGINEPLTGYGFNCDGNDIIGYWVSTTNYKLFYNLNEQFVKLVPLREVTYTT
tara:strand:- start:510 stop:761 length:252 start_codon:yes stop_codon:yes gene_type:complete